MSAQLKENQKQEIINESDQIKYDNIGIPVLCVIVFLIFFSVGAHYSELLLQIFSCSFLGLALVQIFVKGRGHYAKKIHYQATMFRNERAAAGGDPRTLARAALDHEYPYPTPAK